MSLVQRRQPPHSPPQFSSAASLEQFVAPIDMHGEQKSTLIETVMWNMGIVMNCLGPLKGAKG